MRLVFLGPPGAGKGTQAVGLAQSQNIPHISTGDILRQAVAMATPTGVEAKVYMDKGEFVPFEIILRMVRDRIKEEDAANGWIFDGFPRNLDQAKAFTEILDEAGIKIDHVVNFVLPLESVVERLSGRRTCNSCGAICHMSFSPPKVGGKCDHCPSGELFQRPDDQEEAIKTRLEVYEEETSPLAAYYQGLGWLLEIAADKAVADVGAELRDRLGVS